MPFQLLIRLAWPLEVTCFQAPARLFVHVGGPRKRAGIRVRRVIRLSRVSTLLARALAVVLTSSVVLGVCTVVSIVNPLNQLGELVEGDIVVQDLGSQRLLERRDEAAFESLLPLGTGHD